MAAAFLLTLTALGAVGLNTRPHVQIPATAFIATIALWPVLPGALTEATRSRGFIDWLASNAALMLLLGARDVRGEHLDYGASAYSGILKIDAGFLEHLVALETRS